MYEKFSCCAFWKDCQLGQLDCVFKINNSEKMEACGAYRRSQSITAPSQVAEKITEVEYQPIVTFFDSSNDEDQTGDGQLTLF